MAKHSISESSEFVGEWHLSNGEAKKIAGTLSWSVRKAVLLLHDTFTPTRGKVYGDEQHAYPSIQGTTIDGKFVTMLWAHRLGNGFSFGPAGLRESERLRSSWVVVGAHVVPDSLYSEIRARIPGLQTWLCRSGVSQTMFSKTETTGAAMQYTFEGLAEELFAIPDQPIELGWGIDRNFNGDATTKITVTTSASLRIKSSQPQDLRWFFEQFNKAATLLSFITGSPMSTDHVSAKLAAGGDVDVLVALRESGVCAFADPHDFFMLRDDMNATVETVFSKWFGLFETIEMPSQLARSILSTENLWLHVEFLSLMQALEGFHRATMPGLYGSASEYDQVEKALNAALPSNIGTDHRQSLKSRIKYGNEISLRKRLKDLVTRLALPLRKHILGGDGDVPDRWIATRNYYTHWDDISHKDALDGIDMHHAHVRMRHLLRALYLDLVGIPQEAIGKSLTNSCDESQYLIQLNNSEFRKNNPNADVGAIMSIETGKPESPDKPST